MQFRYSLSSLIGLVCVSAVVLAAWRYSDEAGALTVSVVAVFLTCSATVAGFFGTEATRRIWAPFAIFAWGYMVATYSSLFEDSPGWYFIEYTWGLLWANVGSASRAFDAIFSLLFGFLGTVVCNSYWKVFGPGKDQNPPGGAAVN